MLRTALSSSVIRPLRRPRDSLMPCPRYRRPCSLISATRTQVLALPTSMAVMKLGGWLGMVYRGFCEASLGIPGLGFFWLAPGEGGNAAEETGFEVWDGGGAMLGAAFEVCADGRAIVGAGLEVLAVSGIGFFAEAGITAVLAEWTTVLALTALARLPLGLTAARWVTALAGVLATVLADFLVGPASAGCVTYFS